MENFLEKLENLNEVQSIAIGGSSAAKTSDSKSDIDIYVFVKNDIPLSVREEIIKPISSRFEIGGEYFGAGDEFYMDSISKQLDVMYWDMNWFEGAVENTWVKHYPQNGYSTCFLYTLKNFNIIYDKNNWLKDLQDKINIPYPKELKENIIKRNLMLMKNKPFASYYKQIEKAILRNDDVSVNHRLAAFIASYFDIIFAVSNLLHPSEIRLINYARNNCKILPEHFEENLQKVLTQPNNDTLKILDEIVIECKRIIFK